MTFVIGETNDFPFDPCTLEYDAEFGLDNKMGVRIK